MSVNLRDPGEKRHKVLVTDDEASIRRSLQLLLHAKGYDPHSYASASALLADFGALSADCMIADYQMPDLDGLTLLSAIRAKGWSGSAILLTACRSSDLEARAQACGYAQVIQKPFIRRPVLEALSRLCGCEEGGDCAGPAECIPDCDC
jgi:FixJ family two-component response regulator